MHASIQASHPAPALHREARGLGEKVVALREASRLACRRLIMHDGTIAISSKFQQMRSNSVQAVMIREADIRFERVRQFQALRRTMHHGHSDHVIQRETIGLSDMRPSRS
jgi:hypothetical protein